MFVSSFAVVQLDNSLVVNETNSYLCEFTAIRGIYDLMDIKASFFIVGTGVTFRSSRTC